MCYRKIVRNSYSSVEEFQLSSRLITAGPAQYKPVVLNLFAEGSQIQIYNFVRESH